MPTSVPMRPPQQPQQNDPNSIFDAIHRLTQGGMLGSGNPLGQTPPDYQQRFINDLQQGFGDAGELMQRGIQEAKNRPEVRMFTEPIGGAMGTASGAIGGAVGGLGNFFMNALQGKGFDPKSFGQDVSRTAQDTAKFGYGIGKEAAFSAPIAGAGGALGSAALGASGIGTGVKKLGQKDYAGAGMDFGTAALGAYGAAKQPNLTPGGILDKQVKGLLERIAKNGMPGIGAPLLGVPMAGQMHKSTYEVLAKALNDAKRSGVPEEDLSAFNNRLMDALRRDNPSFSSDRWLTAVDDGTLTKAGNRGAKMSRQDYEVIAKAFNDVVKSGLVKPDSAWSIYESMLPGLRSANPKFDYSKFEKAAGLFDVLDELDPGAVSGKPTVSPKDMANLKKGGSLGVDGGNYSLSKGKIVNGMSGKQPKSGWATPEQKAATSFSASDMDEINQAAQMAKNGTRSGPWTDAYKRPMDDGVGLGGASGDVFKGRTDPASGQPYPQMGQVSTPRLTPSQQGAVTRMLKQTEALKGKAGSPKGDFVDQIMRLESGEMSQEELIPFMQGLVNSGQAWSLQGMYGRLAEQLINAGLINAPKGGYPKHGTWVGGGK